MNKREMKYAIAKLLPSAYEIRSNYGSMPLDDELRQAVEEALTPILEQRLAPAEVPYEPLVPVRTVKDFLKIKESKGPGFFDRMLQEQKSGNSESVEKIKDCPHLGCPYYDNRCAGGNFQCTAEQVADHPQDHLCISCDAEIGPGACYCDECLRGI